MDEKHTKDLQKENAGLKEKFNKLEKAATKLNEDLQKENNDLNDDIELLKEEIADIKKTSGKPKKEIERKPLTPKEKGYTTIMDVPKFVEQAKKNAPTQNKFK